MLCVPMDEDGETAWHQFECDKEETVARSGVEPGSRLVVRIEDEVEVEDDYESE